jgi:hypothetical protein
VGERRFEVVDKKEEADREATLLQREAAKKEATSIAINPSNELPNTTKLSFVLRRAQQDVTVTRQRCSSESQTAPCSRATPVLSRFYLRARRKGTPYPPIRAPRRSRRFIRDPRRLRTSIHAKFPDSRLSIARHVINQYSVLRKGSRSLLLFLTALMFL